MVVEWLLYELCNIRTALQHLYPTSINRTKQSSILLKHRFLNKLQLITSSSPKDAGEKSAKTAGANATF